MKLDGKFFSNICPRDYSPSGKSAVRSAEATDRKESLRVSIAGQLSRECGGLECPGRSHRSRSQAIGLEVVDEFFFVGVPANFAAEVHGNVA